MKYFAIRYEDAEHFGTGQTVDKRPLFFPPYEGRIDDWQELVLDLRDGDYPDYLSSNYCGRICSERMRRILDESATKDDHLQWLSVKVRHRGEVRQYYYLHFPHPPDVLHPQKTIFAGKDAVVKPILRAEALAPHAVFTFPKDEGESLIVSEVVKNRILERALCGLELDRMPVA